MAQRHIQLFRNGAPATNAAFTTHAKVVEYLLGENSPLKNLDVKDGELVLYRYKLNDDDTVHTQVVAAHVDGNVKKFEVVANYDQLTNLIADLDYNHTTTNTDKTTFKIFGTQQVDGQISEIEDGTITFDSALEGGNLAATTTYVKESIKALDTEATIATKDQNGVVTLTGVIEEVDGLIRKKSNTDIPLAKVATTGAAQDVSVVTTNTLKSGNVQTALEELQGKIDDINGKSISAKEEQAVEVTTTTNGDTTIGLKLAEGEKVLSQTADGLKTILTVDTKKYPTETDAEGYVADKAGKTYIQIKGVDGELIDETDAAAFVKDGMLSTATVVKGTWTGESFTESTEGNDKAIKLVWNTDAGKEDMYINAETLVDSYTAGNDWIKIDQDTNKISHKTQSDLPTTAQGIAEAVTGTGAYAETKTFKVPQLTVDAAGHVTAVNEKEVSITLPAKQVASDVAITTITGIDATDVQGALAELQGDINAINAVNWTGDDEIDVDNATHKITHTKHTFATSTSTNDTAVKAVVIPQITVNAAGHVTAIDNKTFNIDCNVTTVSGTEDQIVVTPTVAGEDVNYTVSLANVTRTDNPTVEGETYKNSFADENTSFAYVKAIRTDNQGRVTGVDTVTMTEDIDAGTYN